MNPYEKGFKAGILPPRSLTVSEWSSANRVLNSKSSSEPGRYKVSRTPYLQEPMDLLSVTNTEIQKVVLMFGAQLGKSELGLSFLLYTIDVAPSSVMCVMPTIDMARKFSRQRLEPAFQETPCINNKIAPQRSRDASNSMFIKEFPNGIFILTGSNSPTGLRSSPIRYLFMDETDSYPYDSSTSSGVSEGDPCVLAEKRTSNYARKKILMTSTPTLENWSRIEQEYNHSDKRKYFVKCPACSGYITLDWKQIKWENRDPETTQYECQLCNERFNETHKTSMLRQGEWRAGAELKNKTAGFQLSSLYSPAGWIGWPSLVEEFLRARNDAPLLKTFVNTRLGEVWSESYQGGVNAEKLLARCESYLSGELPEEVVALVMGCDVQGGAGSANERIEISTWGFGRVRDPEDPNKWENEHMYLIQHDVIFGSPNQATVWKGLDILLSQEWDHPSGKKLKVSCCAIDTGGLATQTVYQYCRERQANGVIAIKGSSQAGKPAIGKPSKVDINSRGRVVKKGLNLYSIGTDTIKDVIYSRLRFNSKIHFHSQTGEDYFKQLTGEQRVLKTNKRGFKSPVYMKKPNQDVEALDCAVYAFAAFQWLLKRYPKGKFFDIFSKNLLKEVIVKQQKRVSSNRTRQRGSYVNQW